MNFKNIYKKKKRETNFLCFAWKKIQKIFNFFFIHIVARPLKKNVLFKCFLRDNKKISTKLNIMREENDVPDFEIRI